MRSIPGLAACLFLLTGVTATLDGGDYTIDHPTTTTQVVQNVSIDCDGGCPMGEGVVVDICKGSDGYRSRNIDGSPNSPGWSCTISPPDYGWTPIGNDWNCKLRDSGYGLETVTYFTVIGFGA